MKKLLVCAGIFTLAATAALATGISDANSGLDALNKGDYATAVRLLTPYENRAVVNAGAVYLHGVTDDTLARAAALTGDVEQAELLRTRALQTYLRIGATWWHDRLQSQAEVPAEAVVHFHLSHDGLWLIGASAVSTTRLTSAGSKPSSPSTSCATLTLIATDRIAAGCGLTRTGLPVTRLANRPG